MYKHSLIKRSLAVGLAIGAAGLPATAQAMLIGGEASAPVPSAPAASSPAITPAQQHGLDQMQSNVQQWFATHGSFASPTSSSVPATASSDGGFQWGDAGIGAAGAAVLLGACGLGVATTRRRHLHRVVG